MLDIKLFRENSALIKESEKRRFKDPKLVDEVLKYDELWRKEIAKLSKLRSMRNTVSREINQLKKAGKSATAKIKAMRDTSEKISKIDIKAKKYLKTRDELRYKVGNILDETVPIARDESGNVIVRKWGKPTKFRFKPKHQADLIKLIDGADLDRASKYSGSRFYYLKNELAMLNPICFYRNLFGSVQKIDLHKTTVHWKFFKTNMIKPMRFKKLFNLKLKFRATSLIPIDYVFRYVLRDYFSGKIF